MTQPVPDFAAFFRQVHPPEAGSAGYDPFPWQTKLASRVLDAGQWPGLLDLPTGTGKTTAIEIALFTLAYRPQVLPRRIVLVVDRRVVVDQGAHVARALRKRLSNATDGPAADVAMRLRATFGGTPDDAPFNIAVLRGGMPRDEEWARRPDMPAVVLSTVDQVGSRLLFRGYGVSEPMAPLHAGLLGNDCLYLLDEVQLSTAFAETLEALRTRWRGWHARAGGRLLPDRWMVVPMSATPLGPRPEEHARFGLDDDDDTHPVLATRLSAHKLARLHLVRVSGDDDRRADMFADACVAASQAFVAQGARVTAVVVNRVATARRVHQRLQEKLGQHADVVLLTGRMRPLDRARILGSPEDRGSLLSRISAGRRRGAEARPIVVVATQSIEAGADFDFDALVTECASLDALRQRFGRLDRLGQLVTSHAVVLARHDQVGEKADDFVYGGALAATWQWLEDVAKGADVDFGIAAFRHPPADVAERIYSQVVNAPVLLPAHVEAWAQTKPAPEPDPDVSLWLHGPERGVPEVRVVWRADVHEQDLDGWAPTAADGETRRAWLARLGVAPPSSLEALSLPLSAARAWLQRGSVAEVADVEAGRVPESLEFEAPQVLPRRCLVVSHKGDVRVADAANVRPGITIVVPSSYGGITAGNWDPLATAPVSDLGDLAQLVHRGRVVLRLDPVVWAWNAGDPANTAWGTGETMATPPAREGEESIREFRSEVGEWLDAHAQGEAPLFRATRDIVLAGNPRQPRCRIVDIGHGRVAIVATKRVSRRYLDAEEDRVSDVVTADDESSSFTGADVTLAQHLADVAGFAARFATHLGMPDDIVANVRAAGDLHDVGKADPRFQRMLAGGSDVRLALHEALLAKSRGEARDRAARDEARLRSGYPAGYRHELLSLAMVEPHVGQLSGVTDPELVLHLIASHHGWCRPFAPPVDPGPPLEVEMRLGERTLRTDAAHKLARFDSGVADRYFLLTERYGWWGLAWLEAIVRLADHRASEAAEASAAGAELNG